MFARYHGCLFIIDLFSSVFFLITRSDICFDILSNTIQLFWSNWYVLQGSSPARSLSSRFTAGYIFCHQWEAELIREAKNKLSAKWISDPHQCPAQKRDKKSRGEDSAHQQMKGTYALEYIMRISSDRPNKKGPPCSLDVQQLCIAVL